MKKRNVLLTGTVLLCVGSVIYTLKKKSIPYLEEYPEADMDTYRNVVGCISDVFEISPVDPTNIKNKDKLVYEYKRIIEDFILSEDDVERRIFMRKVFLEFRPFYETLYACNLTTEDAWEALADVYDELDEHYDELIKLY